MDELFYTSSTDATVLFGFILENGVQEKDLERITGIHFSTVKQAEFKITLDQLVLLWKIAIDISNCSALPFKLNSKYNRKAKHFVEHIVLNSPTVLAGIQNWCKYSKLICEVFDFKLRKTEDRYIFSFDILSFKHQNRCLFERYFYFAMRYAQKYAETPFTPVQVNFSFGKPEDKIDYGEFFKCDIKFNAPKNELIFRKMDLETRCCSHDSTLSDILLKVAERKLMHSTQNQSLAQSVKNIIMGRLQEDDFSINRVAKVLGMSSSTLRRKLKDESTSYRAILEKTRKDLSIVYYKNGKNTSEISHLLGYSEPSAFNHAFKNWFGLHE